MPSTSLKGFFSFLKSYLMSEFISDSIARLYSVLESKTDTISNLDTDTKQLNLSKSISNFDINT